MQEDMDSEASGEESGEMPKAEKPVRPPAAT